MSSCKTHEDSIGFSPATGEFFCCWEKHYFSVTLDTTFGLRFAITEHARTYAHPPSWSGRHHSTPDSVIHTCRVSSNQRPPARLSTSLRYAHRASAQQYAILIHNCCATLILGAHHSMRYLTVTCTLPTLKRVFEEVSTRIGENGRCHRVRLEKLLKTW
jgi:hypothetical protein